MIIANKGSALKKHNQKILCFTYTNVAANEIKKRLGETSIVEVSTIHDNVWKIIEPYQNLLLDVHAQKLEGEILNMKDLLETQKWAEKYLLLAVEDKNALKEMLLAKKMEYIKNKHLGAKEFREKFIDFEERFPGIMVNISNFQKVVDSILKVNSYELTLSKIIGKDKNFLKVKYDARYNYDRLEYMKISHETLLDYTFQLVQKSDVMKQVICDQYPYVLVDEYQDTSEIVIQILSLIDMYSQKIGHLFLVGYYGDIKQSIYEKGCGIRFRDIHNGLIRVEKKFNRRCSPEIISLANKIRNDGLVQECIYDNFPTSDITLYNMNMNRQDFINEYTKRWKINSDNKLHCFELTNEKVAEQSGFFEIYNFFKNTNWYKRGRNFELLRDHLLSTDVSKLGVVQRVLFSILNFRYKITRNETMLINVVKEEIICEANIFEIRDLFEKLKNVSGSTLAEYVKDIFSKYGNGAYMYDKCVEYLMLENIKSYDELNHYIQVQLFPSNEEDALGEVTEDYTKKIDDLLEIGIEVFELWYYFVTDSLTKEVEFHTYHGTKGKEYDNVIIFMNSKFGKNDSYFIDLMKVLNEKNEEGEAGSAIESARNLLYVAVTRATKNLSIVYLDDLGEAIKVVHEVFGEIKFRLDLE
jgi:DNA helicase-2/ATP-dependent DNA helicase PcrA